MDIQVLVKDYEAAQKSIDMWRAGVCPQCEGDCLEWIQNEDGSFIPPTECSQCGGTGNIVEYVKILKQELVGNDMSDEKCSHSETEVKLTKSGVKRVCKVCGTVVKDLSDEVTIEKVILPIPDVEKIA